MKKYGTLYFDLNIQQKSGPVQVRLFYSDETSQELRTLPTKIIHTNIEESKYITLHLSGKVNQINVNIDGLTDNVIILNEIEINRQVPFNFQWLRFFIITAIICGIYALFNAKIMEERWNPKSKKQYISTYVLGVIICIVFATYVINATPNFSYLVDDIKDYDDKMIHNYVYDVEYTKALSQGSLKLLLTPNEKLVNLENPYDETARIAAECNSLYDYVYYDGAYYVYFSILPQLIMVPVHYLTGQFLNSQLLTIIFMIFGIISSIKLVQAAFQYWFPNAKFRMFVISVLLLLFSNTLLYTVATPGIYELVAVLGYWLVTGGIYRILTAIKDQEKIKYGKLSLGCLMLASAVSARPNLIIISLFVLPFFIHYLIKLWKQKQRRKDFLKFFVAIAIPYLIVGTILMILNYVRFDSVTEFGAVYQLTSNDMQKLGYRIETIPIGIWHYFFNPPDISLEFPFINTRPNMPQYMGFYGTGFAGVGIFMLMPICILIFFLPLLKKHIKENYPNLWFVIIDAIIVAVISAIAVTLVGASYYRYALDFIWLISMVGICLMMVVVEKIKKDNLLEKLTEGILIILTIFTICVTLGVSIKSESRFFERINSENYYKLKENICFWE